MRDVLLVAIGMVGVAAGFLIAQRNRPPVGESTGDVLAQFAEAMVKVNQPYADPRDELAPLVAEMLVRAGVVPNQQGYIEPRRTFDPTDEAIPDFDPELEAAAIRDQLDRLPENQPGAPLTADPVIRGLGDGEPVLHPSEDFEL